MKSISVLFSAFFILANAGVGVAQDSPFRRMDVIASFQNPPASFYQYVESDMKIKGFQPLDAGSGVVYTSDSVFKTADGGETWPRLNVPRNKRQEIASASFENASRGSVLLFDTASQTASIVRTIDGGGTWTAISVSLHGAEGDNLDLVNAALNADGDLLELTTRIPTSSNFEGRARFLSTDGGRSWQMIEKIVEPRRSDDAEAVQRKGNWAVENSGECFGFKTGCVQINRLIISGKDVTPQPIREIIERERNNARAEAARTPMFAAPPGGSTRISLNRGFDKCTAAPSSQMQTWWNQSYFHDSNIYISGRNRGCSQPQLTAAWVDQVSAMGWGLIPTIVGYQSPCSVCTTCVKHSFDPVTAETQGRGEADIAATDAANLGLTTGSILYYDMERYDETATTPGCRTATTAFLKGWTERVRKLGYKSGTYGSPRNAIDDWQFMPPASRMEAVWMARWDNVPSVWTYVSFPTFPNNVWNNHQRIKQWQAPHNETWGGVTFNIDGNISDGPVAGVPILRNKVADFDGDGKTDISVYRPSTGQWFVAGTLGPSFNVFTFGTAEDILAPGDYDYDGKTDLVVFRPSNSTWYFLTKGAFSFRNYGEPGDIPAQADYDGDGRTDIAVFRPSTGTWYIAFNDSLNSFAQATFGQNGDRPAAADYDGDGKADIAVWRPSDGNWYIRGSAGSYSVTTWGVSTDVPVPGDYDADGKADLAVFRPAEGTWYLFQSAEGIRVQPFGFAGDIPVTGDYDGDGRYDVSVFRPSDNTWYLSQSQLGYTVRLFGVTDDKPIPTAYLPR